MAGDRKPHLRIDGFAQAAPYQRPRTWFPPGGDFGRSFQQHSENLKRQTAEAWAQADSLLASRNDPQGVPGAYLSFETAPGAALPSLDWKSQGIRLAAAKRDTKGRAAGAIFVPDASRAFLNDKLDEYGTQLTPGGEPVNKGRFAPIDRFAAARLETLWVDTRSIPNTAEGNWWECWCWRDKVDNLLAKAAILKLSVSDDQIKFPERLIIYVFGTRDEIARLVSSTDSVAELRLGKDTAAAFLGESRADQDGWISACADRLEDRRSKAAPAVCLLDTGVSRAHPLLQKVLHKDDMHTLNDAWGTDDHDGHGTELAGLSVYGDLIGPIQSLEAIPIDISLESVKVLPPDPFPPNQPTSFGLLTLQAVALPEIKRPDRARIFCLAVGQEGVSGPRATSWSAAIDKAASDSDADENVEKRRRLFIVTAGNIPDGLKVGDLENWDEYEVEDPGQSWNAITVGGVTQKATIAEPGHEKWSCAAIVDSLSPYSRVSSNWHRSVSPIKPELLVEAGNRGVDPADNSMWSGMPSLSLLTTGHEIEHNPLSVTWATSAAAAQIAGIAANLQADDSAYWPETIRALLVHSAQWTGPMKGALFASAQKAQRLSLVRRFGYGKPSLDRARSSRAASLALVSQTALQPFVKKRGKATAMNEMHFYELPWPRKALAAINQKPCRLRVTLSYFVEPNPSADAPLAPARYRSVGLRFELQKKGESILAFKKRVNDLSAAPDELDTASDDGARLLGSKATSAGSLHCDEWNCPGVDLVDRNFLAIYPVGGWWKLSNKPKIADQKIRYSLVITLDGGDVEHDLYAEIEAVIAAKVKAAIKPVEVKV